MKEVGLRKFSLQELQRRKELEPGVLRLWEHFLNITHIPRQSGHEGPMTNFLIKFGTERRVNQGIRTLKDETGNTLMIVPASPGCENKPKLILQGHQDMVCENIKSAQSPAENGVKAYITKDRGAIVHKADCREMKEIQKKWPQKIIDATWIKKVKS